METIKLSKDILLGNDESGDLFHRSYSGDLIADHQIRTPFKIGNRFFVWTKSGFSQCEGLELTLNGKGQKVAIFQSAKTFGSKKTFSILQPVSFELSESKMIIGKSAVFNKLPLSATNDFFISKYLKGNDKGVLIYATIEPNATRTIKTNKYPLHSDLPTILVQSPTPAKIKKDIQALKNKVEKIGYTQIIIKTVKTGDIDGILDFYKIVGVVTTELTPSDYNKRYLGFRELIPLVRKLYRVYTNTLIQERTADKKRFNQLNKTLSKKYHAQLKKEDLYELASRGEAKQEDINRIQASFHNLKDYKEASAIYHKIYHLISFSEDSLMQYYFDLLKEAKATTIADEITNLIQSIPKNKATAYIKGTQLYTFNKQLAKPPNNNIEKTDTPIKQHSIGEQQQLIILRDNKQYNQLLDAYSADTIATSNKVRKPFHFQNELYTAVTMDNSRVSAYKLIPLAEFDDKTHLYGEVQSFSYHGMRVKYGKTDYVISSPNIHFVLEKTITVDKESYAAFKQSNSDKLLSKNKIKPPIEVEKGRKYVVIHDEQEKGLVAMQAASPMYFGQTLSFEEIKEHQSKGIHTGLYRLLVTDGKTNHVLAYPFLRIQPEQVTDKVKEQPKSEQELYVYNQQKAQRLRRLKKRQLRQPNVQ